MSIYFLFLLLKFFEHTWINFTFFFSRLSYGPLFFADDRLNGNFGFVMIFKVELDFSIGCI